LGGLLDQAARVAILTRLWARTPCPVQIRAPSRSSRRLRSHPYLRSRVLMRASLPVRHFTVLRHVDLPGLAGFALARDHHCADTEFVQVVVPGGLAVPTVGGHGARASCGGGGGADLVAESGELAADAR